MPDPRISAKDSSAGVDGYIVLDVRVPLVGKTAREIAASIATPNRIEGTQRDSVVEGNVLVDGCGFADDHTGAVVDEKPAAEFGAGVDVDTGDAVGVLGHDPRQIRNFEFV